MLPVPPPDQAPRQAASADGGARDDAWVERFYRNATPLLRVCVVLGALAGAVAGWLLLPAPYDRLAGRSKPGFNILGGALAGFVTGWLVGLFLQGLWGMVTGRAGATPPAPRESPAEAAPERKGQA